MISRRALLIGIAPLALVGCSTAQIQQAEAQWATIVGRIQAAVATAAKYVPTVESIASTAASLFGPQYTAIVAAGSAAFNTIVATLVNVVKNLSPPPAAARFAARFRRFGGAANAAAAGRVFVGSTREGVQVYAYAA